MTEVSVEPKTRKLVPISKPINTLSSQSARLYTHIHPVLLLSCFYLGFDYLVADPLTTLTRALAPLGLLQIIYCVVCLPASARSSTLPPAASKTPKKKRVQFAKPPPNLASRIPNFASKVIVSISCYTPLLQALLTSSSKSLQSSPSSSPSSCPRRSLPSS